MCISCYERGHILHECNLDITSLRKIVAKYGNFSADEKSLVLDTYFNGALATGKRRPNRELECGVKKA